MWPFWIIISLMTSLMTGAEHCTFPYFLRQPVSGLAKDRIWLSYPLIDEIREWDHQIELTITEDTVIAKEKIQSRCFEDENYKCFTRKTIFKQWCVEKVENYKYLVRRKESGRTHYMCMMFIPRNKNIVSIWEGPKSFEKDGTLCDKPLVRNEWPWLVPELVEWSPCPLVGGFDLRVYSNKQMLCRHNWRPSRLESECVRGEGLHLWFPEPGCSPLKDFTQEINLQCWGHWEEQDYMFVVLSEYNKFAEYVLRFPLKIPRKAGFTAELFFRPICLVNQHGMDLNNITHKHVVLNLKRSSGSGMCYDESETCGQFAKEGRCSSSIHRIANHCRQSCGLCGLLPSEHSECRFPQNHQGKWYLFERDRQELINVRSSGHLKFSTLGDFICKGKHWEKDDYKLLSVYSNGCRPRYTCINFFHFEENVLQYRISKSTYTDQSFDLCHFEDDPKPLGSLIRSADLKTLLPSKMTESDKCGLNGLTRVNASLPTGETCPGVLSDINTYDCQTRDTLTLTLPRCHNGEDVIKKFRCIAYTIKDDGSSFLVTSPVGGGEFSCWVIHTYPKYMGEQPAWKEAHMLFRAQCGTEEDMDPAVARISALSIYTQSARVEKYCPGDGGRNWLPSSTERNVPAGMQQATSNGLREEYIHHPYPLSSSNQIHNQSSLVLALSIFSLIGLR